MNGWYIFFTIDNERLLRTFQKLSQKIFVYFFLTSRRRAIKTHLNNDDCHVPLIWHHKEKLYARFKINIDRLKMRHYDLYIFLLIVEPLAQVQSIVKASISPDQKITTVAVPSVDRLHFAMSSVCTNMAHQHSIVSSYSLRYFLHYTRREQIFTDRSG